MQYHYIVNEKGLEAEDVRTTEPIIGSIDFMNAGNHIITRGSIKTKVAIECGRCLEDFTFPVEITIEEEFPIHDLQALLSEQKDEDLGLEDEEPLFKDNIFDLSEYIRQMILVQTPIQPLCQDACAGLCPTCGKNLNEGPCDCPVNLEALPFAALKEILEDESKSEDVE